MNVARGWLAVATALCLVPVTLLVPGLRELVVGRYAGSESAAHAFMTVNMVAGMVSVPVVMSRLHRVGGDVRRWAMVALLIDAVAFVGMAWAPSLSLLFVFRIVEGAAHLPAITLLMVAGNRLVSERRGGTMGLIASAIMIGVAIGSPLGGVLVERGGDVLFATGCGLLLLAALVVRRMPPVPPGERRGSRYGIRGRTALFWVPLAYAFFDRFAIGVFVSTFTLYLAGVVGLSPSQRGALVALFMIPFALLSYPAGRLADRTGWMFPLVVGNVLFGLTFASYGIVPVAWLPLAMVASGVFSAMMFAPNLLLASQLARATEGEGLFGTMQVAGSLGFLVGPIVGGILVAVTRDSGGTPAYQDIFFAVGLLAQVLALRTLHACRALSKRPTNSGPPSLSSLTEPSTVSHPG